MVNEISFASRKKRNKGILSANGRIRPGEPDWRAVVRAGGNLQFFQQTSCPSSPTVKMAVLRCSHALAVQKHFANGFYAREDVIHSLAAEPHQLRAHNARHEITRHIENLPRCGAIESFAQNRGHGT